MSIKFELDNDTCCELCCSKPAFVLTHKEEEGLPVVLCNNCIVEISKWQQVRENQCNCSRCTGIETIEDMTIDDIWIDEFTDFND